MQPWTICGMEVPAGTKQRVTLRPFPGYEMPATLICGARPGKTVLITAGVHSGEYPGIAAVSGLGAQLDPTELAGRLVLIHCVNTSGFLVRTDAVLPEDGSNLNAIFPGRRDGSCGERIADWFIRELLPETDFVIDLHSGGMQEDLTPCLFFPAKEGVREPSLAAAAATRIPLAVRSFNRAGLPGYAAHVMGIPGLLMERGGMGWCDPRCVDAYREDLQGLLRHLGLLDLPVSAATEQRIIEDAVYLTAGETGLWYPDIHAGSRVEHGTYLGCTTDLYGTVLHRYDAEGPGVVLYHTTALSVTAGMPLVAYGLL